MKKVSTEPFKNCEEYHVRMWIRGDDGYCKQVERSYFAVGKFAHDEVSQYVKRNIPELVRIVVTTYV